MYQLVHGRAARRFLSLQLSGGGYILALRCPIPDAQNEQREQERRCVEAG